VYKTATIAHYYLYSMAFIRGVVKMGLQLLFFVSYLSNTYLDKMSFRK